MALARLRGGHRRSALERRAPAVHRPAAARGRDRDAAALVGPGLEVAGILHARAGADAVPPLLPGGRGAGVSARHRGARQSRAALGSGARVSLLAARALEGAGGGLAPRALRLHALLEPGAPDRLLQLPGRDAASALGPCARG